MRPDTEVGLLLFDEPSAALDPIAEHSECSLTHLAYIPAHYADLLMYRSIRSPSGTPGKQDNGVLVAPLRQAYSPRGSNLVSYRPPQTPSR